MQAIKNEQEYEEALEKANELINCKLTPKEIEELLKLSCQIEKYENKHYPVDNPTKESLENYLKENKK